MSTTVPAYEVWKTIGAALFWGIYAFVIVFDAYLVPLLTGWVTPATFSATMMTILQYDAAIAGIAGAMMAWQEYC